MYPAATKKIHHIPPNELSMHEPCPPFMTWHTSCLTHGAIRTTSLKAPGRTERGKTKTNAQPQEVSDDATYILRTGFQAKKSQTRWVCGAARVTVMGLGNPGNIRMATILADTTRPNSFSTPSFYRVDFVSGDIKSYGESVFYDRFGDRGPPIDYDGRTRHLHAAEQVLDPQPSTVFPSAKFPSVSSEVPRLD